MHNFLGYAKPCAAVWRLALQKLTIHKVLKLGVFLTSQACRMTQAYSLRTACTHRNRATSVWNTESRGLCGLLRLKMLHRVSSSSACCPLVQSGSCAEEMKIEGFLFQNSSRAGGLSPTHLPNHPTGVGTTGTYFPYLFSSDTSHSLPLHCRRGLELCCPACRGTQSWAGLTSLHPPPPSYLRTGSPSRQGNAQSLYRCAFFPAVSNMSSVSTDKYI